ncbi:MAG TPA: exopolysaccharide biosynthesis polyprenyl glycosylphosphotransferase [Bryobacteraceae bacterium]|nr:exopolysaccharide biosynthesis polyprenyl glycosylphosphotransferase [Bryobacteraceae bacterium]
MLVDTGACPKEMERSTYLGTLVEVLVERVRETDILGWYEDGKTLGVIFTEIKRTDTESTLKALWERFAKPIEEQEVTPRMSVKFLVFPDDWTEIKPGNRHREFSDLSRFLKRAIDIAGSAVALLCTSPLMLSIAIAVKATSRGPVFFRQQRVGLYGQEFTFYKFRSMKAENDRSIHESYMKDFISGAYRTEGQPEGQQKKVYKLVNDPRITSIGAFLRRYSLDELPQFYNVLIGDMSLVGPRPPIPYEVNQYRLWHKRRYAVKPGLTGLWQVEGRSRTTFDEMVRMDLKYSQSWSLALDIRIMLKTPMAVLKGEGAC